MKTQTRTIRRPFWIVSIDASGGTQDDFLHITSAESRIFFNINATTPETDGHAALVPENVEV